MEEKKPLPQKVNYNLEEHFIYGKQKTWKKIIEWIITICAWMLLLSYLLYLVYGSLAIQFNWYLPEFIIYTREMVLEIQKYFLILLIVALIATVLLIFWKNYNLIRFGKLKRRKFRAPVENDELSELLEIDLEQINKMQNERYVLLPKNIIPSKIGIGGNIHKEEENEE